MRIVSENPESSHLLIFIVLLVLVVSYGYVLTSLMHRVEVLEEEILSNSDSLTQLYTHVLFLFEDLYGDQETLPGLSWQEDVEL